MKPSALRKLGSGRLPSFEELHEKVLRGQFQFHHVGDSRIWTKIVEYRSDRVLEVVLIIGENFQRDLPAIEGRLVDFGRGMGCSAVEAWARLGLEPALKTFGWKRKSVQLRKDI